MQDRVFYDAIDVTRAARARARARYRYAMRDESYDCVTVCDEDSQIVFHLGSMAPHIKSDMATRPCRGSLILKTAEKEGAKPGVV